MNLANVDMNLLKILAVLIEERNVTRAGQRLGRTQSAVSNALNRLRRLLDDEILVRSSGGLTLTPRAEAIRQPLRELMQLAELCLSEGTGFNPATATGVFRIGMPDRLCLPILPSLLDGLIGSAPGMSLHIMTTDREFALKLLNDERIDLALGWVEKLPSHLRSELLFEDERVYICRRGHPVLDSTSKLELETLLSFPHVVVSGTGGREAIFDSLLERQGHARKRLVSVSNFSSVPYILERSDIIGVFTRRMCKVFEAKFNLIVRPLPISVDPLSNYMIWHARDDGDQKHSWFRQHIRSVCDRL